jgi:hypothetical protein
MKKKNRKILLTMPRLWCTYKIMQKIGNPVHYVKALANLKQMKKIGNPVHHV